MAAQGQIIIIKKKKAAAHAGHHGGAWKVAYADFVTAMMCFFLVMWLMGADEETKAAISHYFNHPNTPWNYGRDTNSDEARPLGEVQGSGENMLQGLNGANPEEIITKPMRPVQSTLQTNRELGDLAQEVMGDNLYALDVSIDYLKFSLPEDLLFTQGSTQLRTEAKKEMDRLGRLFKSFSGYIRIDGHTDTSADGGSAGNQFEFTLSRAVSIMKYLTAKNYVDEERLLPVGSGPRRPYAANDGDEDRRKNRRIEFTLTKNRAY